MNITQEMILNTLNTFGFLLFELTLLFLGISYLVGVIQSYLPPDKIQKILGDRKGKGYFVAVLLGALTPFCSCSTIPFLKGLLKAKAGFGTTLTFLFASPLLNPVIIGLFVYTFGVKVTVFYFLFAMIFSILAGYTLQKLGFEKYVKAEAYETEEKKCGSGCGQKKQENKWVKIWNSTFKDFKKVFPYLFVSVLVGAIIHDFIPTEFIAAVASDDNWLAVPVSSVIGIPLYIRAEAVIPLSSVLAAKGMSLGAVMALIIGSAGASLTEVILLKSIFKNKMIIAFVSVVLFMAISAGYLYQFIF